MEIKTCLRIMVVSSMFSNEIINMNINIVVKFQSFLGRGKKAQVKNMFCTVALERAGIFLEDSQGTGHLSGCMLASTLSLL